MAGAVITTNSDRNLYSQLQNDFSLNNSASVDKDKTPMCLVNELARFNKVMIVVIKYFYFTKLLNKVIMYSYSIHLYMI